MNTLNFTAVVENYWILEAPAPLPYISLNALKRVKDPLPKPEACPYCGGSVKLVNNCEIYGKSIGDWPFAYHCQKCSEAYVGVHPDTDIPVGIMACKKLRKARQSAKISFHEMLAATGMERRHGYAWLAKQLGLSINETHYGWFTLLQCEQALAVTKAETKKCQTPKA
ncbi:hypothetical protein D3C81_700830 [compost metagenome]